MRCRWVRGAGLTAAEPRAPRPPVRGRPSYLPCAQPPHALSLRLEAPPADPARRRPTRCACTQTIYALSLHADAPRTVLAPGRPRRCPCAQVATVSLPLRTSRPHTAGPSGSRVPLEGPAAAAR